MKTDPLGSGIYGIKNIENGMWYIGQSRTMHFRRAYHLHKLRKNKHHNAKLQNAFNQYEEAAFEWTVLEPCTPDMLDIRETSWITYYKSTDREYGYNLQTGGQKHKEHSPETRAKISFNSRNISDETRRKKSLSATGRVMTDDEKNKISKGNTGKKHTVEARQKMSLMRRGRKPDQYTKYKDLIIPLEVAAKAS